MKKILAIGNSFSEDATKYLHGLAESAGVKTKVVNLYVGGCSLERHWENICGNIPMYQVQVNGVLTERHASIDEMLREEDWDFVVTQQASHDSGWLDTYEPFFGLLLNHVRELAPQAEFVVHETWAYEIDSGHGAFPRYNRDQAEMYRRLSENYRAIAEKYGLRMIPCGDVIQALRKEPPFVVQEGGMSLCRDGFHMSFLYGRFVLACCWAKVLLGVTLAGTDFIPSTIAVKDTADPAIIAQIKATVDRLIE